MVLQRNIEETNEQLKKIVSDKIQEYIADITAMKKELDVLNQSGTMNISGPMPMPQQNIVTPTPIGKSPTPPPPKIKKIEE